MFARALVVLLLMLNLGVAAWWALRPAPDAPAEYQPPEGAVRLQLLHEVPARARPQAVAKPAAPAVPPAPDANPQQATATPTAEPAEQARCFSFGPFADATTLDAARTQLSSLGATRANAREVTTAARGWRVFLPAQADRAAAEVMADRIRAAGFGDYLIVPAGDDANSIALGRYGSERGARQREAALRAAGFEAQVQPIGDAATRLWLDVAAGPAFDAAAARRASGAAQANPLDCAALG
jgi:hypothetical protein